jgi:transcriptional regulator with XRE-family HTH domain
MDKSIYTREYRAMLRVLKDVREEANVTQVELAKLLGRTQSFVSKTERGESRLDLIQLRFILQKLDVGLVTFVTRLEAQLKRK